VVVVVVEFSLSSLSSSSSSSSSLLLLLLLKDCSSLVFDCRPDCGGGWENLWSEILVEEVVGDANDEEGPGDDKYLGLVVVVVVWDTKAWVDRTAVARRTSRVVAILTPLFLGVGNTKWEVIVMLLLFPVVVVLGSAVVLQEILSNGTTGRRYHSNKSVTESNPHGRP